MKEFLRLITIIICLITLYFIGDEVSELLNARNTVENIVGYVIMIFTLYFTIKSWFLVRVTNYLINKFKSNKNK